ncbi:sensor histidine kinase [Gemmiger formicilis]|uniref:sensor histidine kinase n=1 Tax=Gemmiger formicilis TaxID=745368 RepID=UPI003521798F
MRRTKRRKQELEYRMLQNEVNPHFIYNTLNSITLDGDHPARARHCRDGHGAVRG